MEQSLHEKLLVAQSVQKFPALCGRFNAVFTRTCHWSLFWARGIQYRWEPSYSIPLRSIL